MLKFEEQNIVVESKIRLEKEDVKNMLQQRMNRNIGVIQPRTVPQIQSQPHPQPHPQPPPSQLRIMRRNNVYSIGIGMGGIH
jgi:hypothetical protein